MKNYDYWKTFIMSGKVDDYLHYIACTKEEFGSTFLEELGNSKELDNFKKLSNSFGQGVFEDTAQNAENNKEGGIVDGIEYRNGNGSVSHAG